MDKMTNKDSNILQEKKIEANELAEALSKLSEDEKLKIYYMIKGIELVNEQQKQPA